MKRILPLILAILLIPGLLAVPARADEISSGGWIQLLDYGYPIGYPSNRIDISPESNLNSISFNNPSGSNIYSYDVFFRTNIPSVQVSAQNGLLTLVSLGDGYYRAFGQQNANSDTTLNFWGSGGSYIDILSYKISVLPFARYAKPFSGYVYDFSYDPVKESFFSGDGSTPMDAINIDPYAPSADLSAGHVAHIEIPNWQSMDFIDIQIASWSCSYDSITVEISGHPVPHTVNFIDSANVQGVVLYLIDISVDLRTLERSLTYPISVDLTGQVKQAFVGSFAVQSCLGFVSVDPPSTETFWFTNLISSISSGFAGMSNWFLTLSQNVSSGFSSVGGWISDLSSTISNWFLTISQNVASGFSSVGSWFTIQTQNLTNVLDYWGQSLKDSIDALPDKIAEALKDLIVPSDSAVQDFGESSQQLAQDRFGGVYEGAMIVDSFAGQLQAQAATQILTVPVVNLNILGTLFPLGGWEVDLVPEGSEVIIEAVKLMIDILATLAFINGIKSRLERTLEQ